MHLATSYEARFGQYFLLLQEQLNSGKSIEELEKMMYSIRCHTCTEGFAVPVGPGSTLMELSTQKCYACLSLPHEDVLQGRVIQIF